MICSNCQTNDAEYRLTQNGARGMVWYFCENCFNDLVEKVDDMELSDRLHWDKSDDEEFICCPVCNGGLFYLPASGGAECDNCGEILEG